MVGGGKALARSKCETDGWWQGGETMSNGVGGHAYPLLCLYTY